jgi:hypothetical protein
MGNGIVAPVFVLQKLEQRLGNGIFAPVDFEQKFLARLDKSYRF